MKQVGQNFSLEAQGLVYESQLYYSIFLCFETFHNSLCKNISSSQLFFQERCKKKGIDSGKNASRY